MLLTRLWAGPFTHTIVNVTTQPFQVPALFFLTYKQAKVEILNSSPSVTQVVGGAAGS